MACRSSSTSAGGFRRATSSTPTQGSSALPIPAPLQFGGPLQLAFELMLNKQAFTGEEITNELTDTSADKAAKVADWAWKAWTPSVVLDAE